MCKKKSIKNLAFLLAILIAMFSSVQSYASSNILNEEASKEFMNFGEGVRENFEFLELSESKIIYTFVENGFNFKYLENILDDGSIVTEKYLEMDGEYLKYDELNTTNLGDSILIESKYNNNTIKVDLVQIEDSIEDYEILPNAWYDDEVWEYHDGPYRDYKNITHNMTVAMIASVVLAAIIPHVGYSLLFGLAGMYFEKKSESAYVEYTIYKAVNRPILMPAFKYVSYLYFDPEYSIKLRHEDNPMLSYIKR